ncbi:MAG: bifunctional 4-hydroxy-2-oxoglutarate aldolase/2-dehydro-3-deoxy-phosphogluconate aldolase [Janthinobacterium lividum]
MSGVGGLIRTVLGDERLSAADERVWDYHEHLFQVSPLLPGDELDDPVRSGAEAVELVTAGMTAMVDATPLGLGRRPVDVAAISARTGLLVVHTTGAHREEHYPGSHWLTALDQRALAERLVREIEVGLALDETDPEGPVAQHDGVPVRAGLVKAGVGYWRISAFERRVLGAAAEAHRTTGVAVMVHLEHGSAATEVLDVLESEGVSSDRVVLAHLDRLLDPGFHLELAARGAFLGYDGPARHRQAPDSALLDCVERVLQGGGGDRLLLGGDVARASRFHAYGGMPGMAYLPERFVPRLVERVGSEQVEALLRDNPLALLSLGHQAPARTSPRQPAVPAELPAVVAEQRLVAVTTLSHPREAEGLARSALAAGLHTLEITLRTEAGLPAIRELANVPGLVVGAGTVRDARQADAAVAAGARFVVTPGLSASVVAACRAQSCPVLPGVATPSEVMAAMDLGLDLLKFFPAEVLGGVRALKALSGPFPDVRFMPTGGISLANLQSYLDLPFVTAVGGSWMVAPDLLAAGRWDEVTDLARSAVRTTSRTHAP